MIPIHGRERLGARFIDLLLVSALAAAAVFTAAALRMDVAGVRPGQLSTLGPRPFTLYAAAAASFAVEAVPTWLRGTTPGKALFGLRVESVNGGVAFWRSCARWCISAAPGVAIVAATEWPDGAQELRPLALAALVVWVTAKGRDTGLDRALGLRVRAVWDTAVAS